MPFAEVGLADGSVALGVIAAVGACLRWYAMNILKPRAEAELEEKKERTKAFVAVAGAMEALQKLIEEQGGKIDDQGEALKRIESIVKSVLKVLEQR